MSWPILLVEDDEELRSALFDILTAQGFRVRTAANGLDALRVAHEIRPVLIVLDLMMPVMDGAEFLHHRATDPALAAVPVVVLTAQTDKAGEVANEVLAVLSKPLHLGRLFGLIRQACDRPLGARLPVVATTAARDDETMP